MEIEAEFLDDLITQAEAIGPERKYLDWLRTQPSALSGQFSWNDGTPFCEPAHWRTAKNSGTGCKPKFQAIPLRHDEHALQHLKGQYAFMPRDWWEYSVEKYLRLYLDNQ